MSVKAEDGAVRLTYHDEDGQTLSEKFDLGQVNQRALFNALFGCRAEGGAKPLNFSANEELLSYSTSIPHPDFVISRKQGKFWRIAERLFDYQGPYRRANEL